MRPFPGSMGRRAMALIAALLATSLVGLAGATEARPPLTLDWSATPDCSSAPRVLADVARILSGESSLDRKVNARVRLARTDRGTWSVVLVTETESGARNRSFDAESCEAAAAGVAFILALAIHSAPSAETAADGQPRADGAAASEGRPADDPSDLPPLLTPPVARAPERSFPKVSVYAAIAVDVGTVPRATLGAAAAIGLRPGRWRFEVFGGYWTPQSAIAQTSAAGAEFQAFSAEARTAYGWPLGPFLAGPLAAVGVEAISATGFQGTSRNFAPSVLASTFGAGGFASWHSAAWLGVRLEVEGEIPFSRPSFVVIEPAPQPNSVIFRLWTVAARALVGADASF